MKQIKTYITLFALVVCTMLHAQVQVPIENEGGKMKVSSGINGWKIKAVYEAEAKDLTLSKTMADYLFQNDYINAGDIIGTYNYVANNGVQYVAQKLKVRDLELNGMHINSVECTVVPSQTDPLIMGNSIVEKFGAMTIAGNVMTINNGTTALDVQSIQILNVMFGTARKDVRVLVIDKYKKDNCYFSDMYPYDIVYGVHFAGFKFDSATLNYDSNGNLVSGVLAKDYEMKDLEKCKADRDELSADYNSVYGDVREKLQNSMKVYVCGGTYQKNGVAKSSIQIYYHVYTNPTTKRQMYHLCASYFMDLPGASDDEEEEE